MTEGELDADRVAQLRTRFRRHWQETVAFNRLCGLEVLQWEPEGVQCRIPYHEQLSAHDGIFHGGVVASLLDTTGCGAVMAGSDFRNGTRLTTVSLAIQYLGAAPFEDLVARARCTRRGRRLSFVEVTAEGATSGTIVAQALITCSLSGERVLPPQAVR